MFVFAPSAGGSGASRHATVGHLFAWSSLNYVLNRRKSATSVYPAGIRWRPLPIGNCALIGPGVWAWLEVVGVRWKFFILFFYLSVGLTVVSFANGCGLHWATAQEVGLFS